MVDIKKIPLPGDPAYAEAIKAMIRVNHAGEYGAKRIYEGQIEIADDSYKHELQHMLEQELRHLDYFTQEIKKRNIRPSIFMPLWHILGKVTGKATAKMGREAAMACTVAIEDTIEVHYKQQLDNIDAINEPVLKKQITKFREEELEHRDTGIKQGAKSTFCYELLYTIVATSSKAAIWLSKRF